MIAIGKIPTGSAKRPDPTLWLKLHLAVLSALALAGLAPPADGNILIVPLRPSRPEHTVNWALSAGALLVDSGALPNSYVVRGSRAALIWPAFAHGALLLDAYASGCSASKDVAK